MKRGWHEGTAEWREEVSRGDVHFGEDVAYYPTFVIFRYERYLWPRKDVV